MGSAPHVDLARKRDELVAQIERQGVRDAAVLDAVRKVPREAFLPPYLRELAYANRPLPIGHEQTISQPVMVAMMAAELELGPHDRVLEIGTGSGYAAAVLAQIAAEVFTVERYRELAGKACERLAEQHVTNVRVRQGDGTVGWPERAPFDAISVAASGPAVPDALLEQLEVGGRLVMPVGPKDGAQKLLRVRKIAERQWMEEKLADVRFVPLVGAAGWDGGSETQ